MRHPRQRQRQAVASPIHIGLGAVEGVDLIDQHLVIAGQRRGLNMEPSTGAGVDALGVHDRHHHRRAAGLQRPGHDGQGLELIVLALPAHLFLGQQRLQHVEAFVEALARLFHRDAEALHLELERTAPDAEEQAPFAENVGDNHFTGIGAHVVERQHHHAGENLDLLGMGSDFDSKGQRRWHHQTVDEVVLGDRNRIKAQPIGELRLIEHVPVYAVTAVGLVRIVGRQLYAELHGHPLPHT